MKKPSLPFMRAMADRVKPRIQPPDSLSDAQKLIWHMTVDSLPADWFAAEQTPMLTAYCSHVARLTQVEAALASLDPLRDLDIFDKLSKLAGLESSKVLAGARAMRLTQQSRLKAETAQAHGAASAAAAQSWAGTNGKFDDLIAH